MSQFNTYFAPQLYVPSGIKDLSFYEHAFGAIELRRFSNDNGSVHVAEFSINDAIFQLHEDASHKGRSNPAASKTTSVLIGLFVDDVDLVMQRAILAGGVLVKAAETYDYGYRQGEVRDPFGHIWLIEAKVTGGK